MPDVDYVPGTLSTNTTYYWRIDANNVGGTTTGTVWSFTTVPPPPSAATNPNPVTGATSVSLTPTLSWTAGTGATSHIVYFGTDSTPDSSELIGNQPMPDVDYVPGTLSTNTTYYWRIDANNIGGTTQSAVWSFTTVPPPPTKATNPAPGIG